MGRPRKNVEEKESEIESKTESKVGNEFGIDTSNDPVAYEEKK